MMLAAESEILKAEPEAKDFFALMKSGVMALVLWTGLAGLWLSPVSAPLAIMVAALVLMALGAGGAAALNMWYERDLDLVMTRTAKRPLPQGRMAPGEALGFGASLSVLSVVGMGVFVNWLAAFLLALTILFYVFIYTMWLKPLTAQNIVIGGAAGAMPPLIGWAASANDLALMPFWLFLIIFFWTPPHFWPLALGRKEDYARAGLPMLPVVKGDRATCWQILIYTLILLPVSLLPVVSGAGWFYATAAVLLGLEFARRALMLLRQLSQHRQSAMMMRAKSLFWFSVIYLFALFFALMADHLLRIYGFVY